MDKDELSSLHSSGLIDMEGDLRFAFAAISKFLIVLIATTILSVGLVAAILLIIYLAFQYPQSANALVMLVLAVAAAPVGSFSKKIVQTLRTPQEKPHPIPVTLVPPEEIKP